MISNTSCPHCWNGELPGIHEIPVRCPYCGGHGSLRPRYDIRISPRQILDGYRATIFEQTGDFDTLLWMDVFETREQAETEANRQKAVLEARP